MKRILPFVLVVLVVTPAWAQHGSGAHPPAAAPVLAGVGNLHHPVSTHSAEAQRFFDQGFNLAFGFNHDEAFRAFQRAAELDTGLAMAWWGQALVLGPNINLPIDDDRSQRAWALVQKALALAQHAPESERAYVAALAKRYAADPKADRAALDLAYADAMRELSRRYPEDLDAATLFAEACMDLHPWHYWSPQGEPAAGTEEILATLQAVLRRSPEHIGACHLLIHAVEASPHPELALGAARQLETSAPGAGHLVHMPSHIYAGLGDHDASARINEKASQIDRAYIERYAVTGMYPVMYFNHNLHFAAYSHTQRGDYRDALRMAQQLYEHGAPMVKEMPMVEGFTPTPLLVQIRFRRWSELARAPQPPEGMPITRALWHFGRGMAEAAGGNLEAARTELAAVETARHQLPADAVIGFSSARDILGIAGHLLAARAAEARGNAPVAIEHLKLAVAAEDSLPYDEPPDWYLHTRESLGGAYLRNRQAPAAEAIFRADLERHPRSGRSLFGLMEALKAQGRTYEAEIVEREYREAWRNADTRLAVSDL
jgi:hypothetical protein